jgi:POT family proton-dependent oligopeptide transporter
MGVGFILMTAAFVMVSFIQEWIDAGDRPNIVWQIGAYALLTASEILISIVALELAYTQAPRKMKSFIMCFYLAAVAIGNLLVVIVNENIRVPSAAEQQFEAAIRELPEDWKSSPRTVVLAGYDGVRGTGDDFVKRLENGVDNPLEVGDQEVLKQIVSKITAETIVAKNVFPNQKQGNELVASFRDHRGNQFRYEIQNADTIRIRGTGGDGKWNTKWDIGVIVSKPEEIAPEKASWLDKLRPKETWLASRKQELGVKSSGEQKSGEDLFTKTTFCGGQPRLQGAMYFWFFSGLMGITAILFIPFAMIYRPKNYLQE